MSSGIPGQTVIALSPSDITTIEGIDGVVRVDPVRTISLDYVQAGNAPPMSPPSEA